MLAVGSRAVGSREAGLNGCTSKRLKYNLGHDLGNES